MRFFMRPDKFHFIVSLIKSGFRLAAGIALISGSMYAAGILLIIAEGLGIIEEL